MKTLLDEEMKRISLEALIRSVRLINRPVGFKLQIQRQPLNIGENKTPGIRHSEAMSAHSRLWLL